MPRQRFIEKLLDVRRITSGQQRRGMLLARLIVITAVFNLVLTLANAWLWLSTDSIIDRTYFFIGSLGIILLWGIWYINRRGYVTLSASFILLLYLGRIFIVTEPNRVANSFWAYLIPIMIASFLIKPSGSFLISGLGAILYVIQSLGIGITETLDITLFKLFLLFSLAALSYFVASHLEHAIETVNESEVKFRNLFNHLPIGLYRTSPEGKILDVNPAFLLMFGYPDLATLQDVNAMNLYADPLSREKHLSIVEKYTTTEMQMRKSDGSLFWVTDHVRPIHDFNGKVIHYEGSLIDISERKKAELELEQLAITDPLTGLPNRRFFFSRAEKVFNQSNNPNSSLAILMIDIDHFKNINDQYGHATGDLVLYEIAQVLLLNLRSNDISGRYGGEEFSIILLRVNRDEIGQIADRLCKTIANKQIKIEDITISVTVSIGIGILDEMISSLDMLLQRADQALYAAKAEGRNRCSFWDPGIGIRS